MLYNVIQCYPECYTMLYNVILLNNIIPYCPMIPMEHDFMSRLVIQDKLQQEQCYLTMLSLEQCYLTMLYNVIQCYTMLYNVIKCYTMLYNVIQCYTIDTYCPILSHDFPHGPMIFMVSRLVPTTRQVTTGTIEISHCL